MTSQLTDEYDVIFWQVSNFFDEQNWIENLLEFISFFFQFYFLNQISSILDTQLITTQCLGDFHVIERRQVVSTWLCFYDLSLSNSTSRK